MMLMKMLMDEFENRREEAVDEDDFEQVQVFDQATSYANNTHGMTNREVIEYMKAVMSSMPTFGDNQVEARDHVVEVIEFLEEVLDSKEEFDNTPAFVLDTERVSHFYVPTASGEGYMMGYTIPGNDALSLRLSAPGLNKEYSEREFYDRSVKTWEDWKTFFTANGNIALSVMVAGEVTIVASHDFVNAVESVFGE